MQPVTESTVFAFGTKAETLRDLKPLIEEATIPDFHVFVRLQWLNNRQHVLDTIVEKFGDRLLAIRSSALSEDGGRSSMAGAYLTKLDVDCSDRFELEASIEEVVQAMTDNPRDQVLIQPMVGEIEVSGVIMTFDIVQGAPYYCIDFDDESGRTDAVTSGTGVHKSLYVHRDAGDQMIRSPRVGRFIALARELERISHCAALDIEFGMNKAGQLFLFQVRRIVLARNWHPVTERRVKRQLAYVEDFILNCSRRRYGVLGKRSILAIMPDWNPAEIIGSTPRPLAASLYRTLITSTVWCRARASMGYRAFGDLELMVLINSHPYIDVRNSFNSFLPAGVSDYVGEKLVNAWLDRLEAFPEFHDKVEFEIVPTCLDFCFREDFQARYPNVLDTTEIDRYRDALVELTRECLMASPTNSLDCAVAAAATLQEGFDPPGFEGGDSYSHLDHADFLLNRCRERGALSFAIVARHAFIAEALLRSAVRRGVLSENRLGEFKRSIRTVTGTMLDEYGEVCGGRRSKDRFYEKYGHLRPGTYEVTSLRYDERDDLFLDAMPATRLAAREEFALVADEREGLDRLLREAGLEVLNAEELLSYAVKAIAGRENVKFLFTRTLSDALSSIVRWGESHGLSRDDLSFLEWPEIVLSLRQPVMDDVDRHYLDVAEKARRTMSAAHAFRLGHIVFGVQDLYVATLNRSVPNFVGLGSTSGQIVQLEANTPTSVNIKGRLVCIENADPGFDWIFTKSPSALITRFGGANSHMAVRCAEFGLPAAVGCGDQLYHRVVQAGSVELNCAERFLRPLHVA